MSDTISGRARAGAIGEIAHDTLRRDFRVIRPPEASIILVEAQERILHDLRNVLNERELFRTLADLGN